MTGRQPIPTLLKMVAGASFLLTFAFAVYRSVVSNFVGQELGISYVEYGLIEGIREIPGLLTIVLVGLAYRIPEHKLYALSGVLVGSGIWMYATAHTFTDLVYATLVQSVGFHVWHVVQDSMVIKAVGTNDRAHRLGQLNSVGAAATLLGMGLVWFSSDWLSLRTYFVIFGIVGIAGGLFALLFPHAKAPVRPVRFVFDWRYRSYYTLALFSGARRHIVLTFATFALIRIYNTSVSTIAMLLAIISFLAIWTRPIIGRIIDRVGEQRALSMNYAVVALIFLGYAVFRNIYVAFALYILDNIMMGFDIAISTHAGRIIPREKLSSSLATGTTVNHIFGVAVPVTGGILWEWFGPVVPFLMGAVLVLFAMVYSWNLDRRVAAIQSETPTASKAVESSATKPTSTENRFRPAIIRIVSTTSMASSSENPIASRSS